METYEICFAKYRYNDDNVEIDRKADRAKFIYVTAKSWKEALKTLIREDIYVYDAAGEIVYGDD